MINYRSIDRYPEKERYGAVNWDRILEGSPYIFLISFFLLLGIMILWAEMKYDIFSYASSLF